ncbi:MAG: hypothetical protein AAGH15_21455 [Myxococcota bacterium]
MTQFVLLVDVPERWAAPSGTRLRPLRGHEREAQRHWFAGARPEACHMLVDPQEGEADPLTFALYEAYRDGAPVDDVPLFRALRDLASRGTRLACWYGNWSADLPVPRVRGLAELRASLLAQTADAPEIDVLLESPQ